jgi:hypothetical protein
MPAHPPTLALLALRFATKIGVAILVRAALSPGGQKVQLQIKVCVGFFRRITHVFRSTIRAS